MIIKIFKEAPNWYFSKSLNTKPVNTVTFLNLVNQNKGKIAMRKKYVHLMLEYKRLWKDFWYEKSLALFAKVKA